MTGASPSGLARGFRMPRVTELPHRWDAVQGREVVIRPWDPPAGRNVPRR
jgi:hypothetical protein